MTTGDKLLEEVGFKKDDKGNFVNEDSQVRIKFEPTGNMVCISDDCCDITMTHREVAAIDAKIRELRFDAKRESI